MQSFNQIIDTLKQITNCTTDKAIAIELNIKPTTYASMKRRQKIPYKAILAYCRTHRIDANTVLLGEITIDEPVVPEVERKIVVKYFHSFEDYALYLGLSE